MRGVLNGLQGGPAYKLRLPDPNLARKPPASLHCWGPMPCACEVARVWLGVVQHAGGPLSAPPALSDPGWPQLSPVEQRGFENKAGVWDTGLSPIRHIPPSGQRAWGEGAAASNPYQRSFSAEGTPSCVGSRTCAFPQGPQF